MQNTPPPVVRIEQMGDIFPELIDKISQLIDIPSELIDIISQLIDISSEPIDIATKPIQSRLRKLNQPLFCFAKPPFSNLFSSKVVVPRLFSTCFPPSHPIIVT